MRHLANAYVQGPATATVAITKNVDADMASGQLNRGNLEEPELLLFQRRQHFRIAHINPATLNLQSRQHMLRGD